MRRAAATACPICSRRGSPGGAPSVGAPPRPGRDCSLPGAQQGAARSNSALQPLARPHSPGTSGTPRPRPGTRGESCHRSWPSLFCTFFPRWTPGPPRGAGGWALSAGLSISPLGCLRPPGSCAPVGAPRALGVAPNGGGTVLPGPPTWPSSLSAACSPALSTRRELPLSQRPPHLDSQVPESAGLCAGQDAVRGAVRTSRPGKGQHRQPARPPELTARPRRPPFPHLQNLAVRPKRSLRSCLSTKNGYILTISARTRAACQGLRPRFHFWALVSYYDDGLHSSLHMVPAPARGSQEGGGVSSCFSEGAFPDPTPSFSPPPNKPQATSHVPVCPLTLGSALVPPYLCLPIFPATTSAATEPHLSSGRFLVWPAGRLPALQTDVSPSLTPTHRLPAGPHPFPAPTAGSREVQVSNPRY